MKSNAESLTDDEALMPSLRAMQKDPSTNAQLMQWQGMAVDAVLATIDDLTRRLAAINPPSPGDVGADIFQVRAQARRRQAHTAQCRELAHQMVFDCMRHVDDAHWNPLESATDDTARTDDPPLLLALLELARRPD